jgi:hypothetical protein
MAKGVKNKRRIYKCYVAGRQKRAVLGRTYIETSIIFFNKLKIKMLYYKLLLNNEKRFLV